MHRNVIFSFLIFLAVHGCCHHSYGQIERVEDYYDSLEKQSKERPQTIRFVSEDMDLIDNYSGLSQIILLRHGEPALNKKGWRKRKEAIQFIKDYDSVGIYPPEFIPVVIETGELSVINTSSIPRAMATAELVFNQRELQRPDPIFREFERKIFAFPNIKLGLKCWLTTSRILWLMGLNKRGIESFSKAKSRAKSAALKLQNDAEKNGKTMLVSHGLLNHYLVKYLKKNGWTEVYDGGKGYLAQKVLVRYKVE